MTTTFHADHVLVGDGLPIRDGAVVFDGDTVVDVGPADRVIPTHAGSAMVRIRGIVFPGLVNAHTHLELSALRGRVPGGGGFLAWVERLMATRAEETPEDNESAIDAACAELVASAACMVGEVTNTLAAVSALGRRGLHGVIFHEVFGTDRNAVMNRIGALPEERRDRVSAWPENLAYVPSPHALYTTHPEAVRTLLARAREAGTRPSLHFAEHPGERRAIEHGDGPVVEWLTQRAQNPPTFSPAPLLEYAASLGALEGCILVHAAEARRDELDKLAAAEAPLVLCPRSNLTIEMRLPPLPAMLHAGIEPGLGTDSLASSGSLDVLAEAAALAARFADVPKHRLFRMASWNGACALGRPYAGRLARGARPGLFSVSVAASGDPAASLLSNLRLPRTQLVPMGRPS